MYGVFSSLPKRPPNLSSGRSKVPLEPSILGTGPPNAKPILPRLFFNLSIACSATIYSWSAIPPTIAFNLLRKYYDTEILKERLLLNHIIVLNNVFGADACATLLLYKIQEEYWPTLKSFLLYLNILLTDELPNVEENEEVYKVLKEL